MKEEMKLFFKFTVGLILFTLLVALVIARMDDKRKKEEAEAKARTEKFYYEYLIYNGGFTNEERAKKRLEELNNNGLTNYVPSNIEEFKNAEGWTAKRAMEKIHNIGPNKGQKKWSDLTPAEQYLAGEGNWSLGDEGCSAFQVYNAICSFACKAGVSKSDIFSYINDIK